MEPPEIQIKTTEPIKVIFIEREGKIADLNKDIDKLYEYLYKNNLQDKISGPTIGLFYTEFGGKYVVAVPIKEDVTVEDNIQIQTLPSVKCVSIIHKGNWGTIENSFNRLKQYRKDNNLQGYFPVREIYLKTDGEEKDYLTEIQIPIQP